MKSLYLDVPGGFIRYHVIEGDGPVHVYLSPLIAPAAATLLEVATHPRLAGRAAILIDYLGCGLSDRPPQFSHTMRDHAGTVAAVLDEEDVTRAVVVGHSMGGIVGLWLAVDRPDLVSHLLLGESNLLPGGGDFTRRIASVTVDAYVDDIVPTELGDLRVAAMSGDRSAARSLAITGLGSDPRAVHAASCDIIRLDPALMDWFLHLGIPRSFVYGQLTLDALAGAWTADVPDPQLLQRHGVETFVVAGASHFMYMDNLDGYVEAVFAATTPAPTPVDKPPTSPSNPAR